MKRFQKFGLCLDPSKKYDILDEIGSHFLDQAVELTRQGGEFCVVLDNLDWDIKVHDMRQENQNVSKHAVASTIVFDRVKSSHVPDNGPKRDINTTTPDIFLLSDEDLRESADRYLVYAARIFVEFSPALNFLANLLPKHISHEYSELMKQKSDIITMPILMKDEKKYADFVDVMDTLETWIHDTYTKAKNLPLPVRAPPPPQIFAPARPDQPASHSPPEQNLEDPLCGVKVPCIGDQLTRIRFAGAKDLRAGAQTNKDRLDHLYPFRIAAWHTKRSFLKVPMVVRHLICCRCPLTTSC